MATRVEGLFLEGDKAVGDTAVGTGEADLVVVGPFGGGGGGGGGRDGGEEGGGGRGRRRG